MKLKRKCSNEQLDVILNVFLMTLCLNSTKSKRFIRLEKKVAFLERIKNHFDNAEKHFNAGALSKPLNKNALSEVNKILALSPNNEDAKNFIKKILTHI